MASTPTERRVGPYVLRRRIAVGGMAEIFEAVRAGEPQTEATIVLKLLLPQHAADPEFRQMLRDEALLQASLAHPNLVRVLDAGEADGKAFIALERVDGLPLDQVETLLARRPGRLSVSIALLITRELLLALGYVHGATDPEGRSLAIVHRDVTPQNVLVSRQGEVRLGDFGIARSSLRAQRTRTGVIKGKLCYLAPEQVTGSAIDARTDLYGVGLILFELLTGARWIQGDSEIEVLRQAEAPRSRRASEVSGVDARLDALVERALRRFPEERYPSAGAFLSALDGAARSVAPYAGSAELAALVAELSAEAAPADSGAPGLLPDPEPEPLSRRHTRALGAPRSASSVRWGRWLASGVLACGVAAAVAVGWPSARARTSRPEPGPPPRATAASSPPSIQVAAAPRPPRGPDPVVDARPAPAPATPPRKLRRAPSASDAGAPASPQQVAGTSELDGVRARFGALRAGLRQRGISVQDLPEAERAAWRRIEEGIAAGQSGQALSALDALEASTRQVTIDAAFVRRKLDRVNALIRRADGQRVDTARLQDLSSTALQELMEGRYESTNRRLDEIMRLLTH